MTRRQRLRQALRFQPTDQVPKDLGGMLSTGVSAFAYPGLVAALGLPCRRPRVYDTGQMLALPDPDVLDALDCDCAFIAADTCSNLLDEPERWHDYDFRGRLPARVMTPAAFADQPDGSILQHGHSTMLPSSYVFSAPHGGQVLDLGAEPPREDLDALAAALLQQRFTPERVAAIGEYCRRARAASDRAVAPKPSTPNGCPPRPAARRKERMPAPSVLYPSATPPQRTVFTMPVRSVSASRGRTQQATRSL